MQRIFIAIIILTATLTQKAAAQVVNVDGNYGLLDNTTHRVLVSTSQPNATLPDVFQHEDMTYDVCTTTLPLVLLEHDDLVRDAFRQGHLTLIDPAATEGTKPFTCPVELRYRGATALSYDKKNYAVKLLDPATADNPDGMQSLDASLLGMRSDNSWILDAMASDMARMRNRVSTDFWLDFSTRPCYAEKEPTMVNGTHGRFVEVFVGDRYWGIYCLTEKIDRKQLRVKKHKDGAIRGIIYKSFRYDNMTTITDPNPDNASYTWQGWEGVYPDNRKGEPFDWKPLLDLYTFLGQERPSFDLLDHLHERLDLPVWRDYVIFCDLLHADDNVAKNIIVYYHDITADANAGYYDGTIRTAPAPGPLSVCPWDLDATWGRTFDQKPIDPTENCNVSNSPNVHLWLSVPNRYINGKVFFSRWEELRQETILPENIWPYFERYFDLFETSGAGDRETERWDGVNGVHLDFKAEADYIRNWIPRRIWYLDGDYEYANEGIIAINTAETPGDNSIYTLDGRLVTTQHSPKPLGPGLYIVGGKKMFVK